MKIQKDNGGVKVLRAGIKLDHPMTVQRFFKDLGGQNLKNYIVRGNANIPMNKNITLYNSKDLSKYLRNVSGNRLRTKRDGKYIIVEVVEK